MTAERLADGRIRAPRPAYGDDGTRGDGLDVLEVGTPLWEAWDRWLRRQGR